MKKTLLTLALSLFVTGLALAQTITTFPYVADWKYKDGGLAADAGKGTISSDATQYDLGGWQTVKEKGTRPFFIAISSGAAVPNTMEFGDGQQTSIQISYMISPAFDFSSDDTKVISFKCGREKIENRISNLELLYTTNYTGDPATTTWESLGENLIPADQAGLNASSTMITVTTKTDVKGASIVLAIRAAKDESFTGTTTAQTKIRITAFTVAKEEKVVTGSLPYEAGWNYRPEIVNADSTMNTALDANVGKYTANPAYFDLSGWEIKAVSNGRTFYLAVSTDKKPVPNTFEICDNKKENIYWLVSPQMDLSNNRDKFLSMYVGRDNPDQLSSNVSVYYSLDYSGDVATATWIPVRENIIPREQSGLTELTMTRVIERLSLTNNKVVFGIKSHKENNFYSLGEKQAKIRIKEFALTLEDPTSTQESIASDKTVAIYPVPASDVLNFDSKDAVKEIIIANNLYQELSRYTTFTGNQISVAQLPFGIYYITFVYENGKVETMPFMKN